MPLCLEDSGEKERRGSASPHLNLQGPAQGRAIMALPSEPSLCLWIQVAFHVHSHSLCITRPSGPHSHANPPTSLTLCLLHGFAVADTIHA